MRALFFLALAVLVVVMLFPRLVAWSRGQFGNRPERRDELVKDPVCQTYVVMSRALRSEVGGTTVHFCSRECQDKYRRGATGVRPVWSGASAPTVALEEDLAAAAAAGFDAVELFLPKLWPDLERRGPDGLAESLTRRRLVAMALGPVTDVTFRDAAGIEKVVAEMHGAATLARRVGADWVLVEPGERPDGADERDALREGRETLDRLCRASERYDVGVALMPVGLAWASLRTVRQAIHVIDVVGRKSLALAVDTFHFYVSGSSLEDLRQCRPRAIALLRLADAPEGERETLRDHHRLVPGTGVAPVRAVLGVVKALGAAPPVAVHVPLPRGESDAAGWARRLREATVGLLRDVDSSR